MRFVSKGRIYYIHYIYCGFSIRWSSYIKKCKRHCVHGGFMHLTTVGVMTHLQNFDMLMSTKAGSNITDENEMTSCIIGTP